LFGSSKERFLWYMRKVVPSGRFLEAGFGRGEMLMLASRFYQCVGLDPSPTAVACAKKKGLHVIQGTLENADLEENSFDLVLLDAVIEHVVSPAAVLQKAHYVLRDRRGGGHRHSEVKRPNLPIARGGMEWFPARLSHISFYSKDSQPAYARSRVSRSPLATTKSHL
jgi:SAM-dependent methyltransferase